MLGNWGKRVAFACCAGTIGLLYGLPAAAAQAQPSFPAPAPGGPTIDFPTPGPAARPSGGPSVIAPTRPSGPGGTQTGEPRPRPVLPQSINLALKVERDGRLTVAETVFVRARATMTRRAPLRVRSGDDRDRVFTVRDITVDGTGRAEVTGEEFVLDLGEGVTTVTYTVHGAVIDFGDRQEVRWQLAGGWNVDVRFLRASFLSPTPPTALTCLAGPPGSDTRCASALTDHGQVLRVVQENLPPGHRIDLSVDLPGGSVPADARFDSGGSAVGAFAITPLSGAGLGVLALALLAGCCLMWLARGRDARALATDVGPVDVLVADRGRVGFASPDGVLPGQVGTVVDERVDVADLSATVVDLAVRNYLWITEVPATVDGGRRDWLLVRRNPPDDALTGYERAVYDAVLPDRGAGPAGGTLSALRAEPPDLGPVRDALYTDVVARGWFSHRPDRDRRRRAMAGVLLAVLGMAATAVLARTVGHALLGVAVVIAGIALAVGAPWLPARTARGSALVQQVRGMLDYLRTAEPGAIPPADRELVFSRSLPYAVVLGRVEPWLAAFATLHSADGAPGPYWFATGAGPADRPAAFATEFPAFLTALDTALAGAAGGPPPGAPPRPAAGH